MIPMLFAIWMTARYGAYAAVIVALTWGVLDMADHIIERMTGRTIVQHILQVEP